MSVNVGPASIPPVTTSVAPTDSEFHSLLHAQIRREFTASHQYLAIAIYFDSNDLPQLAQRFIPKPPKNVHTP